MDSDAPDRAASRRAHDGTPLARRAAWRAVARCVVRSSVMLARRQLHWPREQVDRIVVGFRLRGVRGRGHAWFRAESILNTPLFVGFPGFGSKLWLAHDRRGRYRGV